MPHKIVDCAKKSSKGCEASDKINDAKVPRQMFNLKTTKGQILFLIVTVIVSYCAQFLSRDILQVLLSRFSLAEGVPGELANKTNDIASSSINAIGPKYATYGRSGNDGHLKHVNAVLHRLGMEKIGIGDDWDMLWAHDYPFRSHAALLKNLKPHQKVNHFPGCGYITSKLELSMTNVEYVPKSFKLPQQLQDFLRYAKEYPRKLFVQKHNEHRHIKIIRGNQVEINANNTFVQEFISNPYLVDGYKFDIGVYVVITSIDPLRVYIYKGDVLFRYCPTKYHPFDPSDPNKYVVGDDYLPTWEVPALAFYYNDLGFGMKDAFDAFVRSQGRSPNIIWENVEQAIRSIILAKEKFMIETLKHYKSKRNFFEMIRFDLIIDDNLNAYVMEANMSPNLSSAHFKMNSVLYEQVLYSLFNLVGIGSPGKRSSLRRSAPSTEEMMSALKNVVVNAEVCAGSPCTDSCDEIECKLCRPCMTDDMLNSLHAAFREHIHRSDTRRIYPVPIFDPDYYEIKKDTADVSVANQLMTQWFYSKCRTDFSWCS